MNSVHKNYNLQFSNKKVRNVIDKGVSLINPGDHTYISIMYYLSQIQYAENITDIYLPQIDNALNGVAAGGLEVGSEDIEVGQTTTTIIDNGKIETLPTVDFRSILQEYAIFLKTSPLSDSGA